MIPTMKIGKKDSRETSKSKVVKIQQKRKKEAANIVVRPTLYRVSILAKPNDIYIYQTHTKNN